MELTHTDKNGKATMADVSQKEVTTRTACARAKIKCNPDTITAIKNNALIKGDVLSCACIAGIQAGKKTAELIPLCHTIPIEKISLDFDFFGDDTLIITSFAKCEYKTGIEMEALTAVSIAALCVYDMCKAIDRKMEIGEIKLVSKSGGRSGDFVNDD